MLLVIQGMISFSVQVMVTVYSVATPAAPAAQAVPALVVVPAGGVLAAQEAATVMAFASV